MSRNVEKNIGTFSSETRYQLILISSTLRQLFFIKGNNTLLHSIFFIKNVPQTSKAYQQQSCLTNRYKTKISKVILEK